MLSYSFAVSPSAANLFKPQRVVSNLQLRYVFIRSQGAKMLLHLRIAGEMAGNVSGGTQTGGSNELSMRFADVASAVDSAHREQSQETVCASFDRNAES